MVWLCFGVFGEGFELFGRMQSRWKPFLLVAVACLLFAGLLVFAPTISTFGGGESGESFSFFAAGGSAGSFSIPLNANVSSVSMDLVGEANFDVDFNWDVNSEAEFDAGAYSGTDFNSLDGNGFVGLTAGSTSGDYNSRVFDAGSVVDWNSISWGLKDFNCPEGMAFIPKLGGFCIDKYEASHSDATFCDNSIEWSAGSEAHYGESPVPASVAGRIPWTTISQTNAATACAAAGKHLCSSEEWMAAANLNGQVYGLSDAVTDAACVVGATNSCPSHSQGGGAACNTGSTNSQSPSNCVSAEGVFDLIGNVYDWTSDVVDVNADSADNGWNYPNDDVSPPLWGNGEKSLHYGNDGVYTSSTKENRAVLRGGGWSIGGIAGLFSAYLSFDSALATCSVGFRCCAAP